MVLWTVFPWNRAAWISKFGCLITFRDLLLNKVLKLAPSLFFWSTNPFLLGLWPRNRIVDFLWWSLLYDFIEKSLTSKLSWRFFSLSFWLDNFSPKFILVRLFGDITLRSFSIFSFGSLLSFPSVFLNTS